MLATSDLYEKATHRAGVQNVVEKTATKERVVEDNVGGRTRIKRRLGATGRAGTDDENT